MHSVGSWTNGYPMSVTRIRIISHNFHPQKLNPLLYFTPKIKASFIFVTGGHTVPWFDHIHVCVWSRSSVVVWAGFPPGVSPLRSTSDLPCAQNPFCLDHSGHSCFSCVDSRNLHIHQVCICCISASPPSQSCCIYCRLILIIHPHLHNLADEYIHAVHLSAAACHCQRQLLVSLTSLNNKTLTPDSRVCKWAELLPSHPEAALTSSSLSRRTGTAHQSIRLLQLCQSGDSNDCCFSTFGNDSRWVLTRQCHGVASNNFTGTF